MEAYKQVVNYVLAKGKLTGATRTGSRTLAVPALQMHYDLSSGRFPLLTTRKMNFHAIAVELEGYLKGITDKQWYKDNGCSFWNEWGYQPNVEKKLNELGDHSDETKKIVQREERDMFSGYGWEWRHHGAKYDGYDKDYTGVGKDKLREIVEIAKKDPFSRRMKMHSESTTNEGTYALDPCVHTYQFSSLDGKTLDLTYEQRSCDLALGGANDFPEAALLLILVARAANMLPGMVTAQITCPHIYEQHFEKISEQMQRSEYPLPILDLEPGVDCFNFTAKSAELKMYQHHPFISYERNV